MTSTSVERTGFFARFGNPLDWPPVSKCLLVAFINLSVVAAYRLQVSRYLASPDEAQFLNVEKLGEIVGHINGFLAAWAAVLVIGFPLRKKSPESAWFAYLTVFLWSAGSAYFLYLFGNLANSVAITLLIGGVIGFLLFDKAVVLVGMATIVASVLASTWAVMNEKLPYAPLMAAPPYVLLAQTGPIFLGAVAFVLLLFVYVVTRWRDREEKLAAAYQDLRAAQEQLVRAESLAAVGSLVTGAAHELRNPLSSSGALFQSLRDELGEIPGLSAEHRQDVLETIDMGLKGQRRAGAIVERLYRLTDDLETGKSSALLDAFSEILQKKYPSVRFVISPDAKSLRVRQSLLETVVPNLIDNALSSGGSEAPSVEMHLENSGSSSMLQILVADIGRGIPKAIQGEIFKPFFTGQKAGEGHGVGLGLYIVHELLARMDGSIRIESEEGKGTRAIVRVPLRD